MTPADTPRTDAEVYGDGQHPYVPTEFARQLERELAEAIALPPNLLDVHAICNQRDKAVDQLAEVRRRAREILIAYEKACQDVHEVSGGTSEHKRLYDVQNAAQEALAEFGEV